MTAVNSELPGRAPALVHLLEHWNFDIVEYSKVVAWMESNSSSEKDAALNWLQTEGAVYSQWVTQDAYAKIQAALNANPPARGWAQ